jgi:hypothetical protein
VLAPVLDAENITYEIHSSPIHIWVDYENKQENSIEDAQVGFVNMTMKQAIGNSESRASVWAS